MGEGGGSGKRYDLEERTETFARRVRVFLKKLPRTISNVEDGRQLVRCSGSVAANYIEANEAWEKRFPDACADLSEGSEGEWIISAVAVYKK